MFSRDTWTSPIQVIALHGANPSQHHAKPWIWHPLLEMPLHSDYTSMWQWSHEKGGFSCTHLSGGSRNWLDFKMVSTNLLKMGSDSNVFRKSLWCGIPGSESFCPPSLFASLLLFQLNPSAEGEKERNTRFWSKERGEWPWSAVRRRLSYSFSPCTHHCFLHVLVFFLLKHLQLAGCAWSHGAALRGYVSVEHWDFSMSPGSVGLEVVTNSVAHEPVLQMSGGPYNEAFFFSFSQKHTTASQDKPLVISLSWSCWYAASHGFSVHYESGEKPVFLGRSGRISPSSQNNLTRHNLNCCSIGWLHLYPTNCIPLWLRDRAASMVSH